MAADLKLIYRAATLEEAQTALEVIYTTNAIESLNRSLRKVIKTKAVFPNADSVFKLMYLAMNNIAKRWNRPIKDWRKALAHFAILFPERFAI